MKIQILGPGCPNCFVLEAHVKKAAEELKIKAEIKHIFDIDKMVEIGMMTSPGLTIDGKLVCQGRIPDFEEIKKWLK